MGFVFSFQNKSFIYRGGKCERIADVMEMLRTEFPSAKPYSSSVDEADDSTKLHSQSCES